VAVGNRRSEDFKVLNNKNSNLKSGRTEAQARAALAQRAALDNPEPIGEQGAPKGNQNAVMEPVNAENKPYKKGNSKVCFDYGNSSAYRIRKLRKVCPKAVERLERGEFKSAVYLPEDTSETTGAFRKPYSGFGDPCAPGHRCACRRHRGA
jgi:hypothetical protein